MGGSQEKGRMGEDLAARHLEAQGWSVMDRNWRAGRAEVDLVVRRANVVAFVEVKARAQQGCGDPLESLTRRKRHEIERVAAAWLRSKKGGLGSRVVVRFDAVAVHLKPGRPPDIRHMPDAWRIGDP